MKIGILTFHWATNYGAVLQAYALQTFLQNLGHNVSIINYKPKIYEYNLINFFTQRHYRKLQDFLSNKKKENSLNLFREEKLKLTKRIFSYTEIPNIVKEYDILISGSDQVMNPFFLKNGEGKEMISPSYFLGFEFNGRRIAYAVSFGCKEYPIQQLNIAKQYLCKFEKIGVRERSGLSIVHKMQGHNPIVVPDPTILLPPSDFINLANQSNFFDQNYHYAFFIRNSKQRKIEIPKFIKSNKILWNNDDNDYSIQTWLKKIYHAKSVITDSFHCVVMCLQLSRPFVVITEQSGKEGMNDRMYTLLEQLGLESQILHKSELQLLPERIKISYNSETIATQLNKMRNIGIGFLKSI